MAQEGLAALDALERRYDGPIPLHLRQAALGFPARDRHARHAAEEVAFFTALTRSQLRAIRLRRADGGKVAGLLADLALYRRERRRWRRIARLFC